MNGYDATKTLRQEGINTPIVALTANVIKGDDEKCFEAGCDDYLIKPIDRQELLRVITKYLPSKNMDSVKTVKSSAKEKAVNEMSADSQVVVSWIALLEQCGDENLVREVVGAFLAETPKYVQMLSEAVKTKNLKDIGFYAHKLKGSSSYVTAAELVKKAQRLELAAMRQDIGVISGLFEQANEEFVKVISFLSLPDWETKAKQQPNNKEKLTC
jgi:ammonium transporter, Amt family